MQQYKDTFGNIRPIPASGYLESDRVSIFENIENWAPDDNRSFCRCNTSGSMGGRSNIQVCNEFRESVGPHGGCLHYNGGYGGFCMLSNIDEVELVKQTPLEWLPTLIGVLKSELGIKEMENRLKNAAV